MIYYFHTSILSSIYITFTSFFLILFYFYYHIYYFISFIQFFFLSLSSICLCIDLEMGWTFEQLILHCLEKPVIKINGPPLIKLVREPAWAWLIRTPVYAEFLSLNVIYPIVGQLNKRIMPPMCWGINSVWV